MYSWDPEQILRLTLQQLVHYFEEMQLYQEKILAPEVNLELIKMLLFEWMGVKSTDETEAAKKRPITTHFPTVQVTQEQMDRWVKAGYPSLKTWKFK